MEASDLTLMLAGPVKIPPRVLEVLRTPSIGHRTRHFQDVLLEIRDLLQYAFGTSGPVTVLSGSGTAGLEAMVGSMLRPGDRVLCLANGKFGERVHELASRYAQADHLAFPWGEVVETAAVEERLEEGDYQALTLCHNETSTAVTNPAAELGRLARKHSLLYMVDGITSVAGLPVDMERWGMDALVLGSQKCLAAPAGLAAVALSERGYEALHEEGPYYLNLKAHVDRLERGSTPYTPAIHLFLAFREALQMLKEEGLDMRVRRTAHLASACRAAANALGLPLLPDASVASDTVSAFRYPAGIEDGPFRDALREKHRVLVAGGQGELKGRIFRIGHMGVCSFDDLRTTFSAVEAALAGMGHPLKGGASLAALEAHAP